METLHAIIFYFLGLKVKCSYINQFEKMSLNILELFNSFISSLKCWCIDKICVGFYENN